MLNLKSEIRQKNVGFVELPDSSLDVLNHYARRPEWDVRIVVSLDEQSYAVRMAEVLQIPTLDTPNRLSLSPCDYIVVGLMPSHLLNQIREMMAGTGAKVISVNDAETRIRSEMNADAALAEDIRSGDMIRPIKVVRPEDESRSQDDREPVPDGPCLVPVRAGFDAGTLLGKDLSASLRAIPFALGAEGVVREILNLAVQATHADSGSIMLVDEGGEHLRIAAAEGIPEDVVNNTRRRIGDGISGRVFSNGEAVIIRGRIPESRAADSRPSLREAACVPILSDGRPIGVLNINAESPELSFNEESVALLMRLAQEASNAILKALDIKNVPSDSRREALLRQVDRLLSLRESLPSRLRGVGEALRTISSADFVHVYIIDPLGRRLELANGPRNQMGARRSLPLQRGTLGWVVRHGSIRVTEMDEPASKSSSSTIYLPIITSQPHALIVLENIPSHTVKMDEVLELVRDVRDQICEFLSVEQGVDAQEFLHQLKLRLTDESHELAALPASKRTRGILEFATNLLVGEAAVWYPRDGGPTVTTSTDSPTSAAILDAVKPDLPMLCDWIVDKEAVAGGAVGPGWDDASPHGPSPYVGVVDPRGEAVVILFFSAEEVGTPAQMPPHVMFEVLKEVAALIPANTVHDPDETDYGTLTSF